MLPSVSIYGFVSLVIQNLPNYKNGRLRRDGNAETETYGSWAFNCIFLSGPGVFDNALCFCL